MDRAVAILAQQGPAPAQSYTIVVVVVVLLVAIVAAVIIARYFR